MKEMKWEVASWKAFWQWYDGKFGTSVGFAFPPKVAMELWKERKEAASVVARA